MMKEKETNILKILNELNLGKVKIPFENKFLQFEELLRKNIYGYIGANQVCFFIIFFLTF